MSSVREISCETITATVRRLFLEANTELGEDILKALDHAAACETSEVGRYALEKIQENAEIARESAVPLCQDTGLAVIFIELGQDVHITGGDFNESVQKGVLQAYQEGFFRKSVCDPFSRKNTGSNIPAVVHTEIVPGNTMKIIAMPKGGGSENMSSCTMLLPSAGIEGIKQLAVDRVAEAGPNPCPPVIIGIGIGGSMERAAVLSKKALIRPVGEHNASDIRLSQLEDAILEEINNLGIGPQGYGGKTTALAVHIEMMPCHIASMPVAINIQCHVARHKEAVI
jgi:fumarate hydratase subunit alpha